MKPAGRYAGGYFVQWAGLVIALGWAAGSAPGATNYVSLNGDDANDGTSWATAFYSISNAVARAGNGAVTNVVMVDTGTYVLAKEVAVLSGIALRSRSGNGATILDGNYPATTNRCLRISHSNAVVDGFTVQNGAGPLGGGIHIQTGTVQNCVIQDNKADYHATPRGGGVYIVNSGIMRNCLVQRNIATSNEGGGIYAYTLETVLIENCTVRSNSLSVGLQNGGGMYVTGNNTASNVVIRNCLIVGNSATQRGGGIFIDRGNTNFPPRIENCTIVSNTVGIYGGGGMTFGSAFKGDVVNTIVYYNIGSAASNISSTLGTAALTNIFTYSCVPVSFTSPSLGATVTNLNPVFVSPETGDYRLRPDSPYINWGANQAWMQGAQDVGGRSRIDRFSGLVDLGAYEYIPPGAMVTLR